MNASFIFILLISKIYSIVKSRVLHIKLWGASFLNCPAYFEQLEYGDNVCYLVMLALVYLSFMILAT
jgi:hypothetical protein